jgi:hypothetical protein
MLELKTDRRFSVDMVCGQIEESVLVPDTKTIREDPKIYWTPKTLIGTEGPIWTSISPRIDQIIPPSVLFDDLEAIIARRKQLSASRSRYFHYPSHPIRIWTHLYLGYTMYHHPSETMSG